jgi:osmotically-inducible protein OsmY
VRTDVQQGFLLFLLSKEEAMLAVKPTGTEPDTQRFDPQAATADLAERCLRSNSYLALKNISCDWLDGVLVLRGCLPTYYLKQIAQEAVAPLEGVERIDNQIQVVTPAFPPRRG